MQEPTSPSAILEAKQQQAKRTSGIAGMLVPAFLQRGAQDTDHDARSCDRPRKGGLVGGGGKVKPILHSSASGGSDRQRSNAYSDSASAHVVDASSFSADSPLAPWAAQGAASPLPDADGCDALAFSSAAGAGLASPPLSANGSVSSQRSGGLFARFKKRSSSSNGSKGGSASPGVPSSPMLPGVTPPLHGGSSQRGSASPLSRLSSSRASSNNGATSGAAAAPAALRAAAAHARSGSSGDVDDDGYGSCCSDAMHSPQPGYHEPSGAFDGGDTLDLRQAVFGGVDSPMQPAARDYPDAFTPGFGTGVLGAAAADSRAVCFAQMEPPTPQDTTVALEPTIALLSGAQLAQAGGLVYDAPSVLLEQRAATPPTQQQRQPQRQGGGGDAGAAHAITPEPPATATAATATPPAVDAPASVGVEGAAGASTSAGAEAGAAADDAARADGQQQLVQAEDVEVELAEQRRAVSGPTDEGAKGPASSSEVAAPESAAVSTDCGDAQPAVEAPAQEGGLATQQVRSPEAAAQHAQASKLRKSTSPSSGSTSRRASDGCAAAADTGSPAAVGRASTPLQGAQQQPTGSPERAQAAPVPAEQQTQACEAAAGASLVATLPALQEVPGVSPAEVPCQEPALLPEPSEEPPLPLQAEQVEPAAGEQEQQTDQEHLRERHVGACTPVGALASLSPLRSAGRSARASSGRPSRTPRSVVRESIPLYAISLALEDDLLQSQALPLVAADERAQQEVSERGAGSAAAAAGAHAGRLLAHGGPQRVALGSGGLGGGLPTVMEQYSPIPEEPSTAGSSASRASSRADAAASAAASPVRPLAFDRHSPIASAHAPAAAPTAAAGGGASPVLGLHAHSPGSVQSTPTFMGNSGAERMQVRATPQSAVSSAVGSAIRPVGSAGPGAAFTPGSRREGLSPDMPTGTGVSPTLTLLPSLTQGGPDSQGVPGGAGSTPSLLDAAAASPSAVYAPLYAATPFRGALAALPIDAARHAPLVDNSPFNLTDDGMDTARLADEAQRVARNLAAAAAGGFAAHTPGARLRPSSSSSPGSAGRHAGGLTPGMALGCERTAPSPTAELENLQIVMLTRQLTEAQKHIKELEGENERLREQVDIYEFEKMELNSQEEMEKAARQYAEEQLAAVQGELKAAHQAAAAQAAQAAALWQQCQGLQAQADAQHQADQEQAAQLQQRVTQVQDERNAALDRLNMLDMELTAVKSNAGSLQATLAAEQGRAAGLEQDKADYEQRLADMARMQFDTQAKLEKLMEQVIAAQTAKEHAKQKASDEASRAAQLAGERQALAAELEAARKDSGKLAQYVKEYQVLRQKYERAKCALTQAEQLCKAREAENQELMGMCDQLLQRQEAVATTQPAGA